MPSHHVEGIDLSVYETPIEAAADQIWDLQSLSQRDRSEALRIMRNAVDVYLAKAEEA